MPIGKQPIDPRISAALPRVRAYMRRHGHLQKDVVELSKQSQPQVSKFLAGGRRRLTPPIRAICQYAGIDLDAESVRPPEGFRLSQTARRVLEDNPRGADLVSRLVDVLIPVISSLRDPTPTAPGKENP